MYETLEESIVATFQLRIFPTYLHGHVFKSYGWANNLYNDAEKLDDYLRRKLPRQKVLWAAAGAILVPLAIIILANFSLWPPYSWFTHLWFGFTGALMSLLWVGMRSHDYPKYRENIRKLEEFLKNFFEICEIDFVTFLPMSHSEMKKHADEILIRLALNLRRFEETNRPTNNIPSTRYDERRVNYMRKFEERFEPLKKFNLIHTDKNGGFGWHFGQADKRLKAEMAQVASSESSLCGAPRGVSTASK